MPKKRMGRPIGLSVAEKHRRLTPYGYVYGVSCGRTFVKIGMAVHVPARMKELSAANPFELTLRYCLRVPSDKMVEVERWMHARLAKQRLYKEWFSAKPETFMKAFADATFAFDNVLFDDEQVGICEPRLDSRRRTLMWARKPVWKDEREYHMLLPPDLASAITSGAMGMAT